MEKSLELRVVNKTQEDHSKRLLWTFQPSEFLVTNYDVSSGPVFLCTYVLS